MEDLSLTIIATIIEIGFIVFWIWVGWRVFKWFKRKRVKKHGN